MVREGIEFPAKDEPLREDVRLLGAMVGDVVREQGGEELYERVEAARRAAIRRREGDGGAEEELSNLARGLSPETAERLVRAFSTYFQVVNLAERVHRLRRRREYLREGKAQPESLADVLPRLREEGVDREELDGLLARLEVEPVFTAHPTEAVRRTILEKEQRMARALVDRFDPSRTPPEERAALERVRAEVTAGWQTEEHLSDRPTVRDEREHVLFYLTDVIVRIVPPLYEALARTVAEVWDEKIEVGRLPRLLSFGSWVGGDMDGNPNVTAETLRESLLEHHAMARRLYRPALEDLARRLSQSLSRVEVAPEVVERLEAYAGRFPEVEERIPSRHREMPYRILLRHAAARLDTDVEEGGYGGPEELLDDLRLVACSLRSHGGERAGLFRVERLLRQVETFGFHLATLDVRQDALVLRRAVGELLGEEGWLERAPGERTERLCEALAAGQTPAEIPEGECAETVAVFEAIAWGRSRFGAEALGPFVISMARGTDDVLGVLLLARAGGVDPGGLDVAPLFETVEDLRAAPEVLDELLSIDLYRAHLAERGDRQMVMIGYSDSNKDGGLASSRWRLHRAQEEMAEVLADHGVDLTVFHGRGGTISRGGGRTHRAVLAAPAGTVRGRLRMTEQGEVIHARYGLRGIAERTLERTIGAVLRATARPGDEGGKDPRRREIMEVVARESRRSYRSLVYEDAGLVAYFRAATPIDVIERMPLGSRPASRRAGEGIEDLRAIPWVFAWTQSRHVLPAWYGLGTGLEAACEEAGEEAVASLAREWPFLRNLLDDAEMVLAKADMGIAARYAALAGDEGRRIFRTIESEYERTVEMVLRLLGTSELLEQDRTLARSIRLRNPYVDPMSLLQVELLARWRDTGREDDDLLRALKTTTQGIAKGLQNTG